MTSITKKHFERAAADIGEHGDNDTLPFDIDNRFVKDKQGELADIAYSVSSALEKEPQSARSCIDAATIFSERLLSPSGPSGFRTVTKIHPFWTIYFNGLCIAVAEALEPTRSDRAYSYRFAPTEHELFDRRASWRSFRLATLDRVASEGGFVVQTDVSSFYEHVYHHRLENCIRDFFPGNMIADQIDRMLSRMANGRSFGLPVGGQGARILAEALLSMVDQRLDDSGIDWMRYVDDFVLMASTPAQGYRALSVLSNALSDYGLTLNRAKTTLMSARHYSEYARAQLGLDVEGGQELFEIDLHFDPYSDDPCSDFEELREVVAGLDVSKLLNLEISKSQPDTFLVAQISRTLKFHDAEVAIGLCKTLLSDETLHAFRASWSKIMRGVSEVRGDSAFASIHSDIDRLLDVVPSHSPHLLLAETSVLHYLRTLRFSRTNIRSVYIRKVYEESRSQTVRRACVDCWRQWKHRASFTSARNSWNTMQSEEQRMLWLAACDFGDEGLKFRAQVRKNLATSWALGIEKAQKPTFATVFTEWADQ